eukprot:9690970-Lingulodinium_polyedra.AAC.1
MAEAGAHVDNVHVPTPPTDPLEDGPDAVWPVRRAREKVKGRRSVVAWTPRRVCGTGLLARPRCQNRPKALL